MSLSLRKPVPLMLGLGALWSAAAGAAIPTPARPLTDPHRVVSPANPDAAPVPLADLSATRGYSDAAWSADGHSVFVVTNLAGRYNIWRTDLGPDATSGGSWPVQLVQSEDSQESLAPSPDGKTLYFVQDAGGNELYDLYSVPTAGGPVRRWTDTPAVTETAPVVSPDGRRVAFTQRRKDGSSSNIAVLELATGTVRALTAETDPSMTWWPTAWTPDGRALIVTRGNIDQTRASVWQLATVGDGGGAGQPPSELTPGRPGRVLATGLSPDGRRLGVSVSDGQGAGQLRAGWLDLADARHDLHLAPATVWEQNAGSFSPDARQLVVRTGVDGREALGLLDTRSGAVRDLSLPPGLNSEATSTTPSFSADGRRLLVNHAAADTPGELVVADVATGKVEPLTHFAMASLAPARLPKSQIVTFPSFDGTPISAVLTVPFNLARDGRNPAVVYPHGGPTGQAVDGFSKLAAALASRGYLVIQPNFRGSTGYGQAFQDANRRDLGGGDLKDVLAARDFLVATGYVDPGRVGITGGSYGGFMTLMAVGRAPQAFAAGVQSYGIINWRTMWQNADGGLREYQRALVGDPDQDPGLYKAQSPLTYLLQARAPLLSLQGENDARVPRGQAQEVADLLKQRHVPTETIFYPDEGHGFAKREHQLDALTRTVAWFDRYLKGEAPGSGTTPAATAR